MKKILYGLMIGSACTVAAADMSDITPYGGLQYAWTDFKRGDINTSLDSMVVRGGARFGQVLGAEARLSTGIGSGSHLGEKVKNRYNYGAYGLVNLPTGEAYTPYALAGYTYARTEIGDSRQRDDGLSYGAGVDWALDDIMSVNVEVLRSVRNDFTKQTVVGLGIAYRF
ncbi:porin family protein [Isoalcanivorax indicus]|uniref:porin family protein n=1 Tax=Isoalcanivorax indicus TaxID=2202653 RepID=UPI0013C4A306|nr:porin family protein [Isoalcanivorax indicus]